ncbi:MAG: RNA-binding protein [Deltaproteobacteria bacterium]|nr:MAG: RNA-binding protein [Deltaproteobacteria bacterium]
MWPRKLLRFFELDSRRRQPISSTIFVGNLSFDTTEEELHAVLAEIDSAVRVRLGKDRVTGRPRGFAFAEFSDPTRAADAITSRQPVRRVRSSRRPPPRPPSRWKASKSRTTEPSTARAEVAAGCAPRSAAFARPSAGFVGAEGRGGKWRFLRCSWDTGSSLPSSSRASIIATPPTGCSP